MDAVARWHVQHTPIQDYQRQGDWVVLEYASRNGATAVAGIFRLAGSESGTYPLYP